MILCLLYTLWFDRSFKPILRLLSCHETPEVQYWAVWALCNLTKVYSRYHTCLCLCLSLQPYRSLRSVSYVSVSLSLSATLPKSTVGIIRVCVSLCNLTKVYSQYYTSLYIVQFIKSCWVKYYVLWIMLQWICVGKRQCCVQVSAVTWEAAGGAEVRSGNSMMNCNLLLVCVSWTITGQPRNSIFIRRV